MHLKYLVINEHLTCVMCSVTLKIVFMLLKANVHVSVGGLSQSNVFSFIQNPFVPLVVRIYFRLSHNEIILYNL